MIPLNYVPVRKIYEDFSRWRKFFPNLFKITFGSAYVLLCLLEKQRWRKLSGKTLIQAGNTYILIPWDSFNCSLQVASNWHTSRQRLKCVLISLAHCFAEMFTVCYKTQIVCSGLCSEWTAAEKELSFYLRASTAELWKNNVGVKDEQSWKTKLEDYCGYSTSFDQGRK